MSNAKSPRTFLAYISAMVIACVTCDRVDIGVIILKREPRSVNVMKYVSPCKPDEWVGPTASVAITCSIGVETLLEWWDARRSFPSCHLVHDRGLGQLFGHLRCYAFQTPDGWLMGVRDWELNSHGSWKWSELWVVFLEGHAHSSYWKWQALLCGFFWKGIPTVLIENGGHCCAVDHFGTKGFVGCCHLVGLRGFLIVIGLDILI